MAQHSSSVLLVLSYRRLDSIHQQTSSTHADKRHFSTVSVLESCRNEDKPHILRSAQLDPRYTVCIMKSCKDPMYIDHCWTHDIGRTDSAQEGKYKLKYRLANILSYDGKICVRYNTNMFCVFQHVRLTNLNAMMDIAFSGVKSATTLITA